MGTYGEETEGYCPDELCDGDGEDHLDRCCDGSALKSFWIENVFFAQGNVGCKICGMWSMVINGSFTMKQGC